MQLVFSNMEKEFRRQMSQMFEYQPEIQFKWMGNKLEVYHPRGDVNKATIFEALKNEVSVSYRGKTHSFRKQYFRRISDQVWDIICFWTNELMSRKDLAIFEPSINSSQYALLQCKMHTGQVLTTNGNMFGGWGDVYTVFDNLDSARDFAIGKLSDKIESVIYDSNYKYVKTIR